MLKVAIECQHRAVIVFDGVLEPCFERLSLTSIIIERKVRVISLFNEIKSVVGGTIVDEQQIGRTDIQSQPFE